MATQEKAPSRWAAKSWRQGLGTSRIVARAILSLTERERGTAWRGFPMGQRTKGSFRSASSYLLHQLIHRSQEAEDTDAEEQSGEGESDESEDSEMANLEVCLPATLTPVPDSLQPPSLAAQWQLASAPQPSSGSAHSFRLRAPFPRWPGLFFAAYFCTPISGNLHLMSGGKPKPFKYLLSFRGF